MTASVKIRTSWTDDNVITEGVRIYKKDGEFDQSSRPSPLVELTGGETFYEDFDVEENETLYYMLSCFLGEQEVFTECFKVDVTISLWLSTMDFMTMSQNRAASYNTAISTATLMSNYDPSTLKWSNAIVIDANNLLYCPRNFTARKINFRTGDYSDIPISGFYASAYTSGVLAKNGFVYCPPMRTDNILKINTSTLATSQIPMSVAGDYKYYGAVLADNDKIYCAPLNSSQILAIDTANDSISTISASSGYRGAVSAQNGKIYFVPFEASRVMVLDTATETISYISTTLSGSNKWNGGVLGADGKIYCAPSSANDVLIIDPLTDTVSLSSFGLSLSGNTKWSGGTIGADGNVYFAPSFASGFLVINTILGTASIKDFGISAYGSNAHSGVVLAPDGNLYTSPNSFPQAIKITKHASVAAPPLKYCLSPHINKF